MYIDLWSTCEFTSQFISGLESNSNQIVFWNNFIHCCIERFRCVYNENNRWILFFIFFQSWQIHQSERKSVNYMCILNVFGVVETQRSEEFSKFTLERKRRNLGGWGPNLAELIKMKFKTEMFFFRSRKSKHHLDHFQC